MITLEERFEGVKDTLKTIPTINRPVFSRVSETRESETLLYSISLSLSRLRIHGFSVQEQREGLLLRKRKREGRKTSENLLKKVYK